MAATLSKKEDLRVSYGRGEKPDSEMSVDGRSKGRFMSKKSVLPLENKDNNKPSVNAFKDHSGNKAFDAVDLYSPTKMAATLDNFFGKKDDLRVPYGRGKKPDSEKSVDLRSEMENKLKAVKLCTGDGMKDLENPAPLETLAMDPENKNIISGVFANSKENKDKASVKVYTRRVGQVLFWDTKLQRHRTLEELELDREICDDLREYRCRLMEWKMESEFSLRIKGYRQLMGLDREIYSRSGNLRINADNCWDSMELKHPATFEELGMDPENKGIISDFFGFVRANELCKRIGQASRKNNCLVYDSPGTGRSRSIIAAMANYLKFDDIYHLDLTSFSSLKELDYTLLSTRNRSVIAIEGLYQCAAMILNHTSDEAAKYLMMEIDALFLKRNNERIFVFTTNHRDQHDAASLHPVGMDIYINTSSPLPTSLPDGGKRTYHSSLLVSNSEKENTREAYDSTKGYSLPNFDATENQVVKVYSRRGRGWSHSMELKRPPTFVELGKDPENEGIISDLLRFVRDKELYKWLGKDWKRGYLLYDSPGTDRSSLIAAMANYLKFDIYDLDLTRLSSIQELRDVLVSINRRSLIAIKDFDHWFGMHPNLKNEVKSLRKENELTLSGLFEIIEGLLAYKDQQIIVLTANHNHRDRYHTALLSPLNIDAYMHTSSPQPIALPDGGDIVELDSSQQKPLVDFDATKNRAYQSRVLVSNSEKENTRETSKRRCMTESALSSVHSTTVLDATDNIVHLGRAYQSGPTMFNSEKKDTTERLSRECLTKRLFSSDDSKKQNCLPDHLSLAIFSGNTVFDFYGDDTGDCEHFDHCTAMLPNVKDEFVDGLSSSCGNECIILSTTNHRDRHDAALLPVVNMDTYIHTASPQPIALLDGGENVLLQSIQQKSLVDFDATNNRDQSSVLVSNSKKKYTRVISKKRCRTQSLLSLVESTTRISSTEFDYPENREHLNSPIVFNSEKKDTREALKGECLDKNALSLHDSTKQNSCPDFDATINKAHLIEAYQNGPVMSLSDENRGDASKRECIGKSILGLEDLRQHFGGRRDDDAKGFGDSLAWTSFEVLETLAPWEQPNGCAPLLSLGRSTLGGCVQQEKSPDLPRVMRIDTVGQRVTKLPRYLEGLTAQSASSSRWPIGLPDGGHIVLLDPLEQSTQNIVHLAGAKQCSSTVSLLEEKMARTLKRKYKAISIIELDSSVKKPLVDCDATTNMGFQSGVLVSYSKRRCMTLSGVSGFYRTYSLAQKSFEVQETLLPLKQLRNSADTDQVRQIRTLTREEPSNPCGSFPIHMDTLIGRFRRYLFPSLPYSVCIRSIFWEQPNDFVPLLSPRRLPFKGCVQLEKSPYLPGLLQIEAVERGLTKLPRYSGGSTGQSASSSHWPIGLLDGGNVVLLDPLEQSTKNVAHAAKADLCSPTVSLPKKKMVRKSLKTKCPTMSLIFEGNRQHFGRRCEVPAKSLGVTPICMKHGINRVSSVNRIHKPHGIHWLPFRQKWATKEGYSLRDERPFEASSLSMDEKLDSRLLFIHMSHFARPSPQPSALPDGGEIVRPIALSSSEFAASNNRAHLVRQDQSGSTSRYAGRSARETLDRQGITMSLCTAEDLQQHFGCKHKDAAKRLVNLSMFKSTYRLHQVYWRPCQNKNNDSLAWKPFEERQELWFHMPDSLTRKSFKVLDVLTLLEQSNRIRHFVPRKRLALERWNCSGGLTPQSASHWPVGLPDGGHIVPVSKKKNVTITFKRKCKSRSATFEDHNRHFSSRCKGAANSLGVKHMCKQHGINLVFTVKLIIRRQHGIHRCPFQRGFSFGGERLAEVISLMEVKLASRLQFLCISWLARSSLRPLAFSHGSEIERHIAFSSSEFAATNNRARSSLCPLAFSRGSEIERHIAFSSSEFATTNNRAYPGRQGNGQRGSSGSHPERERTGETPNREGIAFDGISFEHLQQHVGSKREVAARSLGISVSTFKRVCRSHGIKRWPRWPNQARRVLRPPDPHGENNPSPTHRTLSTIGQINLQNEMGGQNLEPNVFQLDAFVDQAFFNTESASIAEIPSDFDWTEFFANSIEGNVFGSLNLTVAACSNPAPSQQPMSTCFDPALSQQAMPTCSDPAPSIGYMGSDPAPSQQPMPTCSGPAPSQQAMPQPMPTCFNLAPSQQPMPPCSNPALSQQPMPTIPDPMPTIPDPMPTIHMMSDLAAREDTRCVELKITCRKDMLRFEFPLMSGIIKLKEEVKKRLQYLELDSFEVKYIDDEGDRISLNCDEDLRRYLQLSSNQVICRLLVVDRDANTTNLS